MQLLRALRAPAAPAAVVLLGLLAGSAAPAAAAPDTFPLDDVRPGMTATFHTVLQGTKIERFDVELLSVVHDVGPGQDMILAKALGERIAHEGVSQGMSGSPVYVDGKLVGAVSSTWSFTKEPLLGITPAGQMSREAEGSAASRRSPPRWSSPASTAASSTWRRAGSSRGASA